MIRQVAKVITLCMTVQLALVPALASAHQGKLKGYLFTRSAVVKDITGNCQCVWKWYTVGLQPGTVRLTITLRSNGPTQAPTYAVLVSLLHDGIAIKDAQVACDAKQAHCGKRLTVSANIKTAGVYYIYVHGEGSNAIAYSLGLQGHVYPLHCKSYCR